MGIRRRNLIALFVAAVLLAAGGAAALMTVDEGGPFPTAGHVATSGFAVWPADTPEEAEAECDEGAAWRHDPKATALRFAADVLGYPDPTADDWNSGDPEPDNYRTLVNSRGVKGVFLGSALDEKRFGECWYVVDGMPREGDVGLSIAFLPQGRALLHSWGPAAVEIGWGGWTENFTADEFGEQTVLDLPAGIEGQPGHYIATQPDDGVSEYVGARPLAPVPDPATDAVEPLALKDRSDDKEICEVGWTKRVKGSPRTLIRDLKNWAFTDGIRTRKGYQTPTLWRVRRLGSDHLWRVQIEDADLRVHVTRVGRKCWALDSITPSRPVIRKIHAGPESFTVDLRRGGADVVHFLGAIGAVIEDRGEVLDEPLTFHRGDQGRYRFSSVLVMTYRNGRMLSAEHHLYEH